MALFPICSEDPVVRELRKKLNASPLKMPENRIKPLSVFSWHKNKADFKGALKFLLTDRKAVKVKNYHSRIPDFGVDKTRTINTNLGLKILGGFLKGFGLDASPFSAAFKSVRQVSFSFQNVKRHYIDKNQFGQAVKGTHLDLENPALSTFKDSEEKFMLVNSVIISNEFCIHTEKTKEANFEIDLELINEIIGEFDSVVEITVENKTDINFKHKNSLTFAFTSFEVEIDWKTGKMTGLLDTRKDAPVPLSSNENFENDYFEALLTQENELFGWDN